MTKQEFEEIAGEICDKYCRYPYEWDEEREGVQLIDSDVCKSCPLNREEEW